VAPVVTNIPVSQHFTMDACQNDFRSREHSQQSENSGAVTDQLAVSARATPPLVLESRPKALESQVGEPAPVEDVSVRLPSHAPETKDQTSTDRALEAALQEAVRAEADSHTHEYSDTEMEISLAADPSQLVPETASQHTDNEVDSPEYSPVLERAGPAVPEVDMTEESDIYEPPEATPPVDVDPAQTAPASPSPSPSFSPAPPEESHESDLNNKLIDVVDTELEESQELLPVVKDNQVPTVPVTTCFLIVCLSLNL
jgi:hypothetical protein